MSFASRHSHAPGDSAGGVLVIGYGNTLRSDDGIGWHAASLLADDPRLAGAEVLAVHQLTPELALDMSRATLVILIDASTDDPPGAIAVRPLAAEEDGAPEAGFVDAGSVDSAFRSRRDSVDGPADQGSQDHGAPGATSHHVGPGELLALARALYGAAPGALVVSIGVADMEVGEALSPAVAAALPVVANLVVDLVRRRGLPPAS